MDLGLPPPPKSVQRERAAIDTQAEMRTMNYDASKMNEELGNSPTGSPAGSNTSSPGTTVSPSGKRRRARDMRFDPSSIAGGKRRTKKKCGGKRHKKSKTSKKRGHKKSKTSKKRGHKKRA